MPGFENIFSAGEARANADPPRWYRFPFAEVDWRDDESIGLRRRAGGDVGVGAWVWGCAQGVVDASSGKRPMTFADLQRMKRVSDPQISPSGKWVMFSVTEVDLEENSKVNHLWVVPLAGGARVRRSGR